MLTSKNMCETFRSPRITIESLKMGAFPFTLQGATQDWWYYLFAQITNWKLLKESFLKSIFLHPDYLPSIKKSKT
ncbi:hypothetical protein VIGAN_11169200 [Vigna angularis var. angularis]|uniref:Retrotransposon gag domain-containing protein n=1 Tax=Vigna angularis var. angularis TaxID=157739 RepID=A0A0S3TB26_PHAAN|nr:hypothetical protein VIGAN_11169200 [Vigna angularis var. angularis]